MELSYFVREVANVEQGAATQWATCGLLGRTVDAAFTEDVATWKPERPRICVPADGAEVLFLLTEDSWLEAMQETASGR